jgi:hypothetical protein
MGDFRTKCIAAKQRLFDHLVCKQLHRVGHLDAERLSGFEIDDELEFGRLHHRQIGRLLAFENPTDIDAHQTIHVRQAIAVCIRPPARRLKGFLPVQGTTPSMLSYTVYKIL